MDQPSASERALRAARFSLSVLAPEYSARRRLTFVQLGLLIAFGLLAAAALMAAPAITLAAASTIAALIFMAIVLVRFLAAAFSLAPGRAASVSAKPEGLPVYTLLCPLFREARVLRDLAARIARLDYPADKLDVKIILEADDAATIDAFNGIEWGPQFELIVVPAGRPRTKPKALNYALAFARGAFVTVYDAEDDPDPSQLRAALDAFAAGGENVGCVQAPLYFDNGGASWIASQCAAEYAIQFGEILPLLARLKLPLMLGGTSNHFRTHALIGAGGWDPYNVTEDADIGYRLAREDWRSSMIKPPTWEEAPATLGAWIKQRARWIKGHMQTWAVLMREPSRTWRELGPSGFLSMQLVLGGGVLAAAAHGPFIAFLTYAALNQDFDLPRLSWALASTGYVVAMYNVLAGAWLRRDGRMAFAALTMPFYWPLASIAAFWALIQLVFKPHYWDKTEHGLTARGAKAPMKVDVSPPKGQTGALPEPAQ